MTDDITRASEGPVIAIIAGSGMNSMGKRLEPFVGFETVVPFDHIDGVGGCTVEGHSGNVLLGRSGNGRQVALVLGRRHFYEGGSMGMRPLMGWLAHRGVGEVVAVSAAGSVINIIKPGELVVIKDIIDLQNRELRLNRQRIGGDIGTGKADRFERGGLRATLGASEALSRRFEAAARRAGVMVSRGVLACGAGPAYETPSEIRALQRMGADVATMSAGPEVQFARQLGLDIAVVAAVTNSGTGIGLDPPQHHKVLETADAMCGAIAAVVAQLV
jgi:purine-nucleoside phosphorylase